MERKTVLGIMFTLLFIGMLTLTFDVTSMNVEASSEFPTDMPLVYVDPQNISALEGETFMISVKVFNLTDSFIRTDELWEPGEPLPPPGTDYRYFLGNLYGFAIDIAWDPTLLEYVSHTAMIPVEDHPDGILHQPVWEIKDEVDTVNGRYSLHYSSMSPAEPFNCPDANVIVFTITFNVTEEGVCPLRLEQVELAVDPRVTTEFGDKESIPHQSRDGLFRSPGASGTIYIRADGSVDPDTAPISSVDNVTYTFTDNIYGSIVVERDNIVVDGAGYTLQGTGSGTGIDLSNRSNATIRNMTIFWEGIRLYESSNNTISGNNITANNDGGVSILYSSNNTISRNNITNNKRYGILLSFSSNNTVSGNNITNNDDGILLSFSSNNNSISGNNITANSWDGIKLMDSSNCNAISGNSVTNNKNGIFIHKSSKNTLTNNVVNANRVYGVHLWDTSNDTLTDNIVSNNYDGIIIELCSNAILRNNTASRNIWNFGVGGVELSHFVHDIDASNKVEGKSIQYLVNRKDIVIDSSWDVGYLCLVNSTNVTAKDLTLTIGNWHGIKFAYTKDSRIENVTISRTSYAIDFSYSSNNTIINSVISNRMGIKLRDSSGNAIINNSISNTWHAVSFFYSSNNTITNNYINNNRYGIWLCDSSDNKIYHNNFVENTQHIYDSSIECPEYPLSINIWDDGHPSGGNYWSNYTGVDLYMGSYQNETGGDGIGDTPYIIDENNQDNYPLMVPYDPTIVNFRVLYYELLEEYNELVNNFNALNSTYYELVVDYESLNSTYHALLEKYNELVNNFNALNSTYYELVVDYESLNSTYHALLSNYTELQANYGSLQTSYDNLQASYNALNITYHELLINYNSLNSSYTTLQDSYDKLQSDQEATINELNITRNLMYIFIAATIILIATTVYFMKRKRKGQKENKNKGEKE